MTGGFPSSPHHWADAKAFKFAPVACPFSLVSERFFETLAEHNRGMPRANAVVVRDVQAHAAGGGVYANILKEA